MTKGYDKNKIQFALVNDKITHIKDITKGDIVICLECGEELIIRDGTKNIKHLAHSCDTECKYHKDIEYCNESYQHKYVKIYIKENAQTFKKLDAFQENSREIKITDSIVEYTKLKQELNLESMYIPDVLLLTAEGYICLEIYKTNKKDSEHLKNLLYPRNIQVYEIDINNIDILDLNMNDIYTNMELIYDTNLIICREKEYEIKVLTKYNLEKEFMEQEKKLEKEFKSRRNKLQKDYIEARRRLTPVNDEKFNKKLSNLRIIVKALGGKTFDKFRNRLKEDILLVNNETDKSNLKQVLLQYNGVVGAFISSLNLEILEKIIRIHSMYYNNRTLLLNDNKGDQWSNIKEIKWSQLFNLLDAHYNLDKDLKSLSEIKKLLK